MRKVKIKKTEMIRIRSSSMTKRRLEIFVATYGSKTMEEALIALLDCWEKTKPKKEWV